MKKELRHKIFCIANEKGGTGKSTFAANASIKATLLGYKTLLVDSDSHQMSSIFFSIQRNREDNLNHLMVVQNTKSTIYKDLNHFSNDYDIIIIDSPGRKTDVFLSTIMASGICVIPTRSGSQEQRSTKKTIECIVEVSEKINKEIEIFVFFNLIKNTNSTLHHEYLSDLKKMMETRNFLKISNSFLVDRNVFSTTFGFGRSIYEAKKKDPLAISEFDTIFNQIFFK